MPAPVFVHCEGLKSNITNLTEPSLGTAHCDPRLNIREEGYGSAADDPVRYS